MNIQSIINNTLIPIYYSQYSRLNKISIFTQKVYYYSCRIMGNSDKILYLVHKYLRRFLMTCEYYVITTNYFYSIS